MGDRLSILLDDKEEIWNGERAKLIRDCIVFLFGPRELPITMISEKSVVPPIEKFFALRSALVSSEDPLNRSSKGT